MSRTVVVTGATGQTARLVIPRLLAGGVHVRALAHSSEKAASLGANGVEVVVGDLNLPRTLAHLFDGADAAFLLAPNNPRQPQQMSSALWAARQARVGHVVRMSALRAAHDAPTINSRLHALSDAELAASGLPFTILKPHFFMQNLVGPARGARDQGTIAWGLGQGRLGMVDVDDIAAVAAAVLLDPAPHAGRTYSPTGPASVSMDEVAAAVAAAIGRPVRYVALSLEAADQGMAGWGLDEFMRTMMCDYLAAYAANWGDFVTDDVARVAGRPPRSIADFMRATLAG